MINNTPITISTIHMKTAIINAKWIKNSNENPGIPNSSLIRYANAPSSKYSSNL